MVEVVNLYHIPKGWEDDPQYVYIGRAGKGMSGIFGNPVKAQPGKTAGSTLEEYEEYLVKRLNTDAEFRAKVKALDGKKLVCFCKPKSGFVEGEPERCHGQVLARYVTILQSL